MIALAGARVPAEDHIGSIAMGKSVDFIMLDRDRSSIRNQLIYTLREL